MGADLYIEDMKEKVWPFTVSQEAVDDGYFRDCYNNTGLFAQLNLSWLETARKYELDDNYMSPEDAELFRAEVIEAVDKWEKTTTNERYKKAYLDWANLLIDFLTRAIDNGRRIFFSV